MAGSRPYYNLFFFFSGLLFLFFQGYHLYLVSQTRDFLRGFGDNQVQHAMEEFERTCVSHELFSELISSKEDSLLVREYFRKEMARIERVYYLRHLVVYSARNEVLVGTAKEISKDESEVVELKREFQVNTGGKIQVAMGFYFPFGGILDLQQNALQAGFFLFAGLFCLGMILFKNLLDRSFLLQGKVEEAQKLAEFGTIAAGVAHDIRNPLSIIGLKVQELKEIHEGDRETEEMLSVLRSSMQRINHTVGTLLVLKQESLPMDQEVPLHELLNLVKEEVMRPEFSVEMDVEPFLLKGNRDLIYRMLENLFRNASESREDGNVKLTVLGRVEGQSYRLTLQDDGEGIEHPEKIFQPFYTTKNYGTGLGLMVVKDAVERHNGKIECESAIHKGSSFLIAFPIIDNS